MTSHYSNIRRQIKSGDIIATSHFGWKTIKDWEIQLVRMFTRSEYAHVGITWVVGDRVFMIESVDPYVRIIPLSSIPEGEFYWVSCSNKMSSDELKFLLSHVGKAKYSKWEAIRGFFNAIKVGANHQWQCAELVIAARRLSNMQISGNPTPTNVINECLGQGLTLRRIKI